MMIAVCPPGVPGEQHPVPGTVILRINIDEQSGSASAQNCKSCLTVLPAPEAETVFRPGTEGSADFLDNFCKFALLKYGLKSFILIEKSQE